MKDLKFIVALIIIIILSVTLAFILVINPKVQGYVVSRQIDAQRQALEIVVGVANQQGYVALDSENDKTNILIDQDYLIFLANQNGYVVLGQGDNQVILINQKILEAQLNQKNTNQLIIEDALIQSD